VALPLAYNWRNLFVRKFSTGLTFTIVAVVVCVLSVLLSFAAGIQASLTASGSPENLLVLRPGATSESTSIIDLEDASRLVQAPHLASDPEGRLLISHELYVQTSLPRKGPGGAMANVAVRGVEETAFVVHEQVRIIPGQGRRCEKGGLEVIVGQAARDRYVNLELGNQIALGRLGNRMCEVVGVFEAGGSAFESEIWVPRTTLADLYQEQICSSVVLRLTSPQAASDAIAYINGPAVALEAKREIDYYKELSSKTRDIIILTCVLVGIMAIGAVFAVANTMYAAVDGRRHEIAMLRTIGFSRASIMTAFVIESLLICSGACVFGLSLSLAVRQVYGARQDFLSETTWTVLAYELQITPQTLAAALIVATIVGIVGAMAPAVRAARTGVIEALRKA